MNVLCLNPTMSVPVSHGKPNIHFPLGLAYITGVLQKSNNVVVLDANAEGSENLELVGDRYHSGLSKQAIIERISQASPDIICMSLMFTCNAENAMGLLGEIKKAFPNVITVVGGAHVTVRPEETLRNGAVDFAVIGEGERTVEELIDCILNKGDFGKIKGLGFKKDGIVQINEPRELIRDLDSLPFPPLSMMPMERYFRAQKEGKGQRKEYIYDSRWTTVITSRGCPMNCVFCSIHLTMGSLYRPRSPENVVAEISRDYNEFGIRHFNIEDDNMTWNTERFEKICDLIIASGMKFTWSAPNGVRADRLNEELVRKMALTGCRDVWLSPESGSQRVLDEVIGKKMKLEDIERAVEMLSRNGIIVNLSFVMGLPGETKADMWESIRFAKKLRKKGASFASFNIATPFYGTRLYHEAVEKGYFDDENCNPSLLMTSETLMQTPDWTKEELLSLKNLAMWEARLSLTQKMIYPFRDPRRLPHYIVYFIRNAGKIAGIGKAPKDKDPHS